MKIMKKYLFFAAAITLMASCADDNFVGENGYAGLEDGSNAINFGLSLQKTTRADIMGSAAAELLGNNFYVTGTKGTEAATSPTPTLVFDNYLVHYGINTAGTTESNTANWEYVGVTPGTAPYADYVKLAETASIQTIKYWDYSVPQYDFLAFSTGTYAAVSGSSTASTNIGVTAMKYGTALASSGVAYTFDLPSVDALQHTYISDITEVEKANYGKDVTLKFKNLGSKIRVGLYETVPGYSVKNVIFYTVDGTNDFTDASKSTTATLISANTYGFPTKGTIAVYFPHVGNTNASAYPEDYNKAAAIVTPVTASSSKKQQYGTLENFVDKQSYEAAGTVYLGRNLTEATFAGDKDADHYTTVFPVSSSDPITLRVDYTLVSTDGSGEEIKIYGAKAVVPATYTKWLPNYAYTYIFKISDNTNGWTNPAGTDPAGLFPITFDAIVAEATDANAEQTTITTVSTPTITTYQQGHTYATNEYSKAGNKLYVQVMDNKAVPATLVTDLNDDTDNSTDRSLLFLVSDANATEALVMDALEKRTTEIDADDVKGRNGITLTKSSDINNAVTSIVNGVDNNSITVTAGTAAEINIANLTANKTYAYVYDYTTGGSAKTEVIEYQPMDVSGGTVGTSGTTYYSITTATLGTLAKTPANITAAGAKDDAYIYFSITTNGGATKTYSYYSVAGKANVPAGLLKVAKSTFDSSTVSGGSAAAANTFYFDKYISNDGKYAVKIIKVVD